MNSILGYVIQRIFLIILIYTSNSSSNNENSNVRLRSILHNDSNPTQPSKTAGTELEDNIILLSVISIVVGVVTMLIATAIIAAFRKCRMNRKCSIKAVEAIRYNYEQKFKWLSFVEGHTFNSYEFDKMYVENAELKFVLPNDNRQKSKPESREQDITTDQLESLLGSRGKRVIIEGAPGSGKTTLTKWICRQWSLKRSFTKYKMILRLPLKECNEGVNSLSDAIRKCFPNQQTKVEIILKFVTRNQNDILIILDGYDEIINSQQTSWYNELIRGTSKDYEGCQILVTTRVGFLDPYHCSGFEMLKETPRFRLEFNRHNIKEFIQQYIKEHTTSQEESTISQSQVDGLLDNVSLRELCTCPLVLGMICFLVIDSSEDTINTLQNEYISSTTIYSHFINKLMMKHLQSKSEQSSELFDKLGFEHKFMKKEEPNVGIIAVFLLRNGKNTFTLGDLHDNEFNEQYDEYKSLCEELEELGILIKIDSYYEFFHLSVVEFLSAWHIVRNISEFIPDSKLTFSVSENTKCFIVGLISSLDIKLDDMKLRGILCNKFNKPSLGFYEMIYETLSNEDLFNQCCKAIGYLFSTTITRSSEDYSDGSNLVSSNILNTFPMFRSNTIVIAFYKLWYQLLSQKTNTFGETLKDTGIFFDSENITADSFSKVGEIIELLSHGTLCSQNLPSTCGRDTCITQIDLFFCKKTDQKAVKLLFSSKSSLRCLKEFSIYGDVNPFVKELNESSNIKYLSLRNNNFGPDDMGSLSTSLQNKPNLQILDLSMNQLSLINDADVELFTSALNGMVKLIHLNLNTCNLTDEGQIVPCLSQAILNGQLPFIDSINLQYNLINKEAVVLLKAMLELNKTMYMGLLLEGNPIDKETMDEMADISTEILTPEECSRIASSGLPANLNQWDDDYCNKSNCYKLMLNLFSQINHLFYKSGMVDGCLTFMIPNEWSECMKTVCQRRLEKERTATTTTTVCISTV